MHDLVHNGVLLHTGADVHHDMRIWVHMSDGVAGVRLLVPIHPYLLANVQPTAQDSCLDLGSLELLKTKPFFVVASDIS